MGTIIDSHQSLSIWFFSCIDARLLVGSTATTSPSSWKNDGISPPGLDPLRLPKRLVESPKAHKQFTTCVPVYTSNHTTQTRCYTCKHSSARSCMRRMMTMLLSLVLPGHWSIRDSIGYQVTLFVGLPLPVLIELESHPWVIGRSRHAFTWPSVWLDCSWMMISTTPVGNACVP